jgi:hypothetical protein
LVYLDRCLLDPFSFDHCVVCSSLIYRFWLPPFGIFWPLCCLFFFDLQILITSLWYLLTIVLSVLLWFTDSDYLPLVSSNSSFVSYTSCCEPCFFFLIHNTISIHTRSYRCHLFIFSLVPLSMPSVSSHQALLPRRSQMPRLTLKTDQIRQHTKRYEDATQIFILSVYTCLANARL